MSGLHFSAFGGHVDIVQALLAAGADPKSQDGYVWSLIVAMSGVHVIYIAN
jgi:ankyrin repeat protein